jgi:hypothetical protein
MVSTHAQTIRAAIPQRTADSRRVVPTPTIAPVIVWVVETGMPSPGRQVQRERRGRLGCEPADRLERGDAVAQYLHDAPSARQRAERDGGMRRQDDPQRHGKVPVGVELEVPGAHQQRGDDAHGLPRVVAAVPRLKAAADNSCRRRNSPSTFPTLVRRKVQRLISIRPKPSTSPITGDSGMNKTVFWMLAASRLENPGLGDARACDAADQRMR